jgi:hypothetical protein
VLLDTMYDLPSNVTEGRQGRHRRGQAAVIAQGEVRPILIYADQPKVAGSN